MPAHLILDLPDHTAPDAIRDAGDGIRQSDKGTPRIQIPNNVARIARPGMPSFISDHATHALRSSDDYHAKQLEERETRRALRMVDGGGNSSVEKAESVIRLTSSFLSDLAAQDNKRLEVVQESSRAGREAQARLYRYKMDTAGALKTFL